MTLWRISNHAALDGRGGLIASARWHTQGRRTVYLAGNPASALLEVLVYLEVSDATIPDAFQLLKIGIPEDVSVERLGKLDEDWADDLRVTRAIGDRWLAANRSALLAVPSAIVPETENWLLNPLHPDAGRVALQWRRRFPYGGRLFKSGKR
jgi:RES domain-containing protein